MKKNNKIILLGIIIIGLGVGLYSYIMEYSRSNVNLGTFKKVILNEKYQNVQFSNLDVKGRIEGNMKTGVAEDIDAINKVIDNLKDIRLKQYENEDYNMDNFLTLTFSDLDGSFLNIGIVDNKTIMVQTNDSSDETFSNGYVITNNNSDIMKEILDILNGYINEIQVS